MDIDHPRFGGQVVFAQYGTGETAIIIEREGQRIAVATVNLEGWGVPRAGPGEVWIKAWSENEGMARALAGAGIIDRHWLEEVWGGFAGSCRAVLAKLTPAALAELAEQRR